ncbi:MAG: TolC family protein [Chitinophaga sp.]|uniref:TolC family protein n=1 Tax=Chitinophaga sp. TaxID=1869181 RepID=UPI0025BD246C|nr:TolC family protein [Chitinophaga sp.]MBV8253805.1 TolC family protein [Chitinophaga sp.]
MRTFRMLIVSACTIGLGFKQPLRAQSQPTPITLQAVEDSFLVRNYALLAQRYQIDASKALIRQAKIWDNPSFNATLGFGSTDHVQPFRVGSDGETSYNIDQLIRLAGKRNKSIQLAAAASKMNEATFDELVRVLKLQLRQNYYNIYYIQQSGKVLKEQMGNLQTIVNAYVDADKKGAVAHADLVRLQALQVGLENDYADLKQDELESQKNLQQLLHSQDFYVASLQPADLAHYSLDHIQLPQLMDNATQNRPDVKVAALEYQTAELNYRLQKSLAVPDLHVGATYDKQGSYINNFIGLTVGIDLPLWNRNQGNIRSAQYAMKSEAAQFQQQQNIAQTEVLNAYHRIIQLEKRYKDFDLHQFQGEFDTLITEVAKNFRKGNLSLLQFIDYFNSYSDNAKNINKFLSNRVNAYEELNYATGQELFKN